MNVKGDFTGGFRQETKKKNSTCHPDKTNQPHLTYKQRDELTEEFKVFSTCKEWIDGQIERRNSPVNNGASSSSSSSSTGKSSPKANSGKPPGKPKAKKETPQQRQSRENLEYWNQQEAERQEKVAEAVAANKRKEEVK